MLAGLAFCEMLSQYPRSAFQGLCGVTRGGQQQFATQTLRSASIDFVLSDKSLTVSEDGFVYGSKR